MAIEPQDEYQRIMMEEKTPALLASIVESSEDAIISKTLDGVIRSWNSGAERMFGYTPKEAIGQHIELIIPPDRREEETEIIRKLKQGGRIEHYETARLAKDGRLVDLSITVSPIKDAQGVVIGASKVARDISGRKHVEQMQREYDRRKDIFLAVLAHELRNPLAPVSSAVNVLELEKNLSADGAWALGIISRQMNHVTHLISDLLDVSRITNNKLQMRWDTVELHAVLESALETSTPLLEQGRHHIHTDILEKPLYVKGDAIRLSQVFSNILSNAAKYMPQQGVVTISVKENKPTQEAVLTIRDEGVGIAPDMLPNIFDMFVQADRTNRFGAGLGIGLTLVRTLVELHGGTVLAYSAGLGKGSEFTVRLPLLKPETALSATPAVTEGGVCGRRVLVVDDNVDAAAALSKMLSLHGHDTTVAHDGDDAVRFAEEWGPEIILLDIGMPRMNGYEAARIIRSKPWGQTTVLVAVTGWGQASDIARAKLAGFTMHLTKPVEAKKLLKILDAAVATDMRLVL